MTSRSLAGTILITTLVIFSTCGYIVHLRNQRDDALARTAQVELEAEGYRATIAAGPKEVIKLVPTLVTPTVTAGVRRGTIKPVLAAKVDAHKDLVVRLPADSVTNGIDLKPDSHEPVEESHEVPVHLTFNANLLVTRIKFGIATEWKADAGGSIATADGPKQTFKFDDDEVEFEIRFSDEIAKALFDHEKEGNWLHRHTSLLCPGVGVTYNPLDTTRPVNVGVVCAYGFNWF